MATQRTMDEICDSLKQVFKALKQLDTLCQSKDNRELFETCFARFDSGDPIIGQAIGWINRKLVNKNNDGGADGQAVKSEMDLSDVIKFATRLNVFLNSVSDETTKKDGDGDSDDDGDEDDGLTVNTADKMAASANIFFERAVMSERQGGYVAYCRHLSDKFSGVTRQDPITGEDIEVSFQSVLISKAQREFDQLVDKAQVMAKAKQEVVDADDAVETIVNMMYFAALQKKFSQKRFLRVTK